MKKLSNKNLALVGVTLFSMFFGAGNLIFPPYVGYSAGVKALPAYLGMLLTAVCFPVLGVVAVAKVGGTDRVFAKVHKCHHIARLAIVVSFVRHPHLDARDVDAARHQRQS